MKQWTRMPPGWEPDFSKPTAPNNKQIKRPLVYICCPRRDERDDAYIHALRYYTFALHYGAAPYCPALVPSFWVDAEYGELKSATELMMLDGMDECWVFGDYKNKTPSQVRTILAARRKGVPVRHIDSALVAKDIPGLVI